MTKLAEEGVGMGIDRSGGNRYLRETRSAERLPHLFALWTRPYQEVGEGSGVPRIVPGLTVTVVRGFPRLSGYRVPLRAHFPSTWPFPNTSASICFRLHRLPSYGKDRTAKNGCRRAGYGRPTHNLNAVVGGWGAMPTNGAHHGGFSRARLCEKESASNRSHDGYFPRSTSHRLDGRGFKRRGVVQERRCCLDGGGSELAPVPV